MKTLALVALSLFATAAQAAPVIDFSEGPAVNLSPLYPAQEKQILTQLFPKYVKDYSACPEGDNAEQTEILISDVQAVRGHFASARQEDLVVIFKSVDCNGGHAGEHPNVALVRNNKVIDSRQDLATEVVYKVLDADGDGLLDVIATASYSNMGYTGTNAQTITFKNDQATALEYVQGNVHYDDCGLDGNTEGEFDAVFFADAAKPGSVIQKNYRKACGANRKNYKFYSNGVLDKEI